MTPLKKIEHVLLIKPSLLLEFIYLCGCLLAHDGDTGGHFKKMKDEQMALPEEPPIAEEEVNSLK